MKFNNKLKGSIPSMITIIRILLVPIFLYAFFSNLKIWSIGIFILACLTDAIDGYLARKLDASSSFGAYLDVTADFILISTGFSALIIKGIYPSWTFFIIVFMFLQFILTSKTKIPVYDPVGKYYGLFLLLIIFITLLSSENSIHLILLLLLVIFTIVSIISRLIILMRRNKVQ